MTAERPDEMREVSRILGRMREVCDLMRRDSQSKQFGALWDEFIRLLGEQGFVSGVWKVAGPPWRAA